MNFVAKPTVRAFIVLAAILIGSAGICRAQDGSWFEVTTIPSRGNFYSVRNQIPPLPFDPFPDLPLYSDGTVGNYYYDDRSFDLWSHRTGRMTADDSLPIPGVFGDGSSGPNTTFFSVPNFTITTNYNEYTNFWLAITNTGSDAIVSVMNTLPGFSYTVLTNYNLSLTNWGVYYTFTATNSISPCPGVGLGASQLYFDAELNLGGQSLWVCSNVAPSNLVSWLMGTNPVIVTNITYTGCLLAMGVFTNAAMVGASSGLPGLAFDRGMILSTGWITNALGPNYNDGENGWDGYMNDDTTSPSDLYPFCGSNSDSDLSNLVGLSGINDSAVLEFDIIATNSFQLTFDYVFASEEYPEWIGDYNDPFAIFVSTNFDGTNWVNGLTNDIALVPGTNLIVSVNNINGGCTYDENTDGSVSATNPQYYIDNHGYYDDLDTFDAWDDFALSPYAAAAPVYNLQYDGFTVPLVAQTHIEVGITYHVKIAIGDCSDYIYDSAVFIKAAVPAGFTCE